MRARVRDTEIFFDIDGASLVPDGPRMREKRTAFLVHGGPGNDHVGFKSVFDPLTESLQLVYFDHRGQGRSARGDPSRYTLDENVEDMEALRQYLGLGPIVSVGVSYGGMVAMAHAARYPSAVSHLLLTVTAAHSGFIDRAQQIVAERGTPEQIDECENLFGGRLDTQEKMRHYFEVMGPLYSLKYDERSAEETFERGSLSPQALNRAYGPDGCMRQFDLRPELASITAKTLVIGARHDWICPPEFSQEIYEHIAGSQLQILEDSGHLVRADEPDKFLKAISSFTE